MRRPSNPHPYITTEAATLVGVTFVAATSYIVTFIMARRKKTGVPRTPHSTSSAPAADANGLALAQPAAVMTLMMQEADTRPETSPYGSPACTIPFASPLTLPLDILKRSPKLQAAYESRLPELPAIPEDVGHVLVHYLHTGTYGSLKPKPTDAVSRQICELKTSIQAYAAARAYDLPDLMRLAEAKIGKYGEGLPLPSLLEVARDAYPTLTEGDGWFLEYLRSRIRPHLRDPKLLLGSNLLDQISSILSPNRVLLRTVLELFCERIVARPEPVTSLAASTIASPITSPGSSRPASPPPPASPPSLAEVRSRSTTQDDAPPARKSPKATPWPSPDNISEASWTTSRSPGPRLPEAGTPRFDAAPVPAPLSALGQFPELGPVIIDVVPPPGPPIEARAVAEPRLKLLPEPKVAVSTEPAAGASVFGENPTPEAGDQSQAVSETVPTAQREGEDLGKNVDQEPPCEELKPVLELVPELETGLSPQTKTDGPILREADSGFWEAPDFEPRKEQAPSLTELEPVVVVIPDSAHELESIASSNQIPGTDTRDFAASDADAETKTDVQAKTAEARQQLALVPRLGDDTSVLEAAAENPSPNNVESEPTAEPVRVTPAEEGLVTPENTTEDESPELGRNMEAEESPELGRNMEAEEQPDTEKTDEATKELEAVAKTEPEPEPEPEASSSDPVHVSDTAQPPRATQPEAAEPSVESGTEPAGKLEVQRVNISPVIHSGLPAGDAARSTAVLDTKPAPEQEGTRTEVGDSSAQPCSAQVRQRSWKKRFVSLRYPTLLGRGM